MLPRPATLDAAPERSLGVAAPDPDVPGRLSWALFVVLFAVYAVVSVRSHERILTTGFDLGVFEQTVRSYAQGHLPVVALKGPDFPELGDHFSPILATLAPFYRLWPSPLLLLLAQAALMALAVVPLARWAHRALGPWPAVAVGMGYGASWGIASAVGFDFHEVCFAVPLLAFSLTALGQGRLLAAALWALPLLLVKEDLGLTVGVVGAVIAWRGAPRLGLATAAAGVAGTLLEVMVIIPAFRHGNYTYLSMLQVRPSNSSGLPGQLYRFTVGLIAPQAKALTLVLLLAPTAFLALRSPLVWAVVPTLGWRFFSGNHQFWGTGYHYSAVLMPIVFAAFIDALHRHPQGERDLRYNLIVSTGVTAVLLPFLPLFQLVQPVTWRPEPRTATAHRILNLIPDGATVAASNHLVPQLTNRTTVTVFGSSDRSAAPQWVIVDTEAPSDGPAFGAEQAHLIDQFRACGYDTAENDSGYLLLRRTQNTDEVSRSIRVNCSPIRDSGSSIN